MQKYYLPFFLGIFGSSIAFAGEKDEKMNEAKKTSLKNTAYVKIEFGEFFDFIKKNDAEIKIKLSTKNAYGFDGSPETSAQKETVEKIDNYFKKDLAKMVRFENLKCTYVVDEIEKEFYKPTDDEIGYFKIKYDVKCNERIKNHPVKLNFSKFNNIEYIRVELEGAETEKREIRGNQAVVKYE